MQAKSVHHGADASIAKRCCTARLWNMVLGVSGKRVSVTPFGLQLAAPHGRAHRRGTLWRHDESRVRERVVRGGHSRGRLTAEA